LNKVLLAVLFAISFSVILGSQEAFATTVTISDVPSCEAAGGTFTSSRNQCSFFGDLTIPEGDTWNISNLRFGVRNLILEGEVNAQNEMDVDFMTNRGTITVSEQLISIGGGNFWINDCGATINLLSNTIFIFDASGTNHGTINGDATNSITTNLAANTLDNSGTVDPNIVLNNVALQPVASPCPQDADDDGIPDQFDQCPNDPNKGLPGEEGCGNSDTEPLNQRIEELEGIIEFLELEIQNLLAQIESLFDIISSGEITICHNGDKTKTISLGALSSHLGHGDTIGTCP